MKFSLSPALVKSSLASHSWVGLLVGFLMYLICVSGSLVVFSGYLKRWEQPAVAEYQTLAPAAATAAYQELLARKPDISGDILMMLPRDDQPRGMLVSAGGVYYLNEDGSRGSDIATPWSNSMVGLHDALHIPSDWGEILVSVVGVMLCSLIVSGFLAHPRIFRDAFNFRLGGSRHLEQADIHNRLSVWGAPFHLLIGVTGAWFGLAILMYTLFGNVFFDGDRDAAIASIHGAAPTLDQQVQVADVGRALHTMETLAPDARPIYFNVENANSPAQYILLGAQHPDRLIYVEQYRFDQQGNFLDKVGYSDGEPGKQVLFSLYRLHFGHFGGLPVMILYVVFGIALAVVSVTGINIWLVKRKKRDFINNLWTGLVWGTPPAMAISALAALLLHSGAAGYFWLPLIVAVALGLWLDNELRTSAWLQFATAALLALLIAVHIALFKSAALAGAGLAVNLVFAGVALWIVWLGLRTNAKFRRAVQTY
ncbi:PepSY-associated TM helix domain-containing protein [Microbulbifer bruguierae]|uniref:PepSY-associated TM helix domain-containing protein n=1 Tax=Microbulbifer bruguierae TaxID=3029061 RepID=A0ABY8NDT1_9GAMM|nr:PepSY-associated TM helix domain-containing protein [Microbulbifer bruguierae]WGL16554.1 PepSY-associated TM helix domain-containing protein [Microbulbifer bruguierae]